MFYSETLLSKTGPLARVWLSANLERKLSKSHILQSDIERSVNAIVDQDQAPMALRLSGQLLLGVVRIYSRKARYLLDDCNEALLKIKLAFRPGNVDLPINQINSNNQASLTLPDAITDLDLLPPMPDASLLLTNPSNAPDLDFDINARGRQQDITLMDWSSPRLPGSIEAGRDQENAGAQLEDDVLELDIGDDILMGPAAGNDTSIHIGRDAPAPRGIEDDLISGGLRDDTTIHEMGARKDGGLADEPLDLGLDDDIPAPIDDFSLHFEGEGDSALPAATTAQTPGRVQRDSQSPLSSIRSSQERDLENFNRNGDSTFLEPSNEEEEESVHHHQRVRRRKELPRDVDTMIQNRQLKEQQNNRSKILKPTSFLPRDPMLLTLMSMQRNGGFVSSIFGEGRGKGWAPELRGILSLEVVRKSGELKRKRDRGLPETAGSEKQPRLELDGLDEDEMHVEADINLDGDTTVNDGIIDLPGDDGIRLADDDDAAGASPGPENFDDTVAPIVHPADSGPVSLGTKRAVHLLRDRLDNSSQSSSSSQAVVFQDLLPEKSTSKTDATKMFFEVLVLATKDAVKVEQPDAAVLGGPIRVRGKRGLWGSWAEDTADEQQGEQSQVQPQAQHRTASVPAQALDVMRDASHTVSVGA